MGLAASRQEAFWEACGFGHVNRVKRFLEDPQIDVNWVSYTHDCCPIHVASQGKPEIVQMLLDAKCNVNVKDIRGNLPIHHAAMKGHADIIQTLINNGSEINTQDKNGWTALHCAAYWNYPEAVHVLLKNNAEVHLQNKDERTALHETARSPEQNDQKLGEIAQMLIQAGCDINAKSSDLGEADFTGLMFASYHNHPEVSSAFIEAGCDINAKGTNLWTALHWAADRGNEEMVYLLLESGADPTIKGLRGELAADRAQSPDVKDVLMNAINMWEELAELNKVEGSQTLSQINKKISDSSLKESSQKINKDTSEEEKLSGSKSDVNSLENKERTECEKSQSNIETNFMKENIQNKKNEKETIFTEGQKEEKIMTEGMEDLDIGALELEETTEGKGDNFSDHCVQTIGDVVEKKNKSEKNDDVIYTNETKLLPDDKNCHGDQNDIINANETKLLPDNVNCHGNQNTQSSVDTTKSCTLAETEDSVT